MSSQTTPMTTPYPYPSYSPDEILMAMQNQALNTSVYDGTNKVLKTLNDSTQFLNTGINGLSKDVTQSTLGLRDAIEKGNLVNNHAIEHTAGVTQTAIERVAGEGRLTTTVVDAASRQAAADSARDIMRAVDHTGSALGSAIERNGNATQVTSERIGGNISTAIERVAGENRLTTTVTDAASREAAANQARDLAIAIERNGANGVNATNSVHSALLGSIERNAGENRMTTVTVGGQSDAKLTDVRHAIIAETNRATNELLANLRANHEAVGNQVQNGAWENRSAMTSGFTQSMIEALKSKAELSLQSASQYANMLLDNQKLAAEDANHYSSLLLEQQRMKEYLSSKGDSHFAMNQLEMQKVKEGLSSQSAQQFAINQLEMQKVKEGLACQAAQNFSISQLEAQKSTALISAQLAEAKYEALRSQQLIVDKVGDCCCEVKEKFCEVKEKMDLIDRDRLRDNLVVEREDNNLLKILEFTDLYGGRGRGSRGHHHHGRR
uniref:Uncharacterized protein n=1 Tax=viral metagenome TaxID=1070528 RepID=A0A6C0I3K4_9ZZZZ